MSSHERGSRASFGVVTAFDEYVGLGTVADEHGVEHRFHCVEIADGSRSIALGVRVHFQARRKFGRLEAFSLTPA